MKRFLISLFLALLFSCAVFAQALPAPGYVRLTIDAEIYWLPLPSEADSPAVYELIQDAEDGSQFFNLLILTPEGMTVQEANCPGQDCVREGEVTFENRELRLLGNMLVCLPHRLTAELFTPEEYDRLLQEEQEYALLP